MPVKHWLLTVVFHGPFDRWSWRQWSYQGPTAVSAFLACRREHQAMAAALEKAGGPRSMGDSHSYEQSYAAAYLVNAFEITPAEYAELGWTR